MKVRLVNPDVVKKIASEGSLDFENIIKALPIKSYEAYKEAGGERSKYSLYAKIKENGKKCESDYISMCDMLASDIPVDEHHARECLVRAQVLYMLLAIMFDEPLRKVSFHTFDLKEFNNF